MLIYLWYHKENTKALSRRACIEEQEQGRPSKEAQHKAGSVMEDRSVMWGWMTGFALNKRGVTYSVEH
jgi:hypothetical protein